MCVCVFVCTVCLHGLFTPGSPSDTEELDIPGVLGQNVCTLCLRVRSYDATTVSTLCSVV